MNPFSLENLQHKKALLLLATEHCRLTSIQIAALKAHSNFVYKQWLCLFAVLESGHLVRKKM